MAEPVAAAGIGAGDLGSYQRAVRTVFTHDVITGSRPREGTLATVLPWADRIAIDVRELFGYTLIATSQQVRLVRRLDRLDVSQYELFATKAGRVFDRRRLAYLCLMLSAFQRSRIEIDLAGLVGAFAPAANTIDGLGFDPTITEHKHAVVDVLDWLTTRGALRLSDGSADAWARDTDRGNALYDIDHDICATLFRPTRSLQHVEGVGDLLETDRGANRAARRDAAARRARRLLIENPVVYSAAVDAETAVALRSNDLAENLSRLTGMVVERRAEGVMLVDPSERFTDRHFPQRAGSVNRTAGLLLAKIADLLEGDIGVDELTWMPVPSWAEQTDALAEVIDRARPPSALATERRRSDRPSDEDAAPDPVSAPFVAIATLAAMVTELFEELGASTFSVQWQVDPAGLQEAATVLLDELGLVHRIPGGVLVLPAAARYRNIKAALPKPPKLDGQGVIDFTGLMGDDG
jgi:uncharacterized protein (TIGR02678 family)